VRTDAVLDFTVSDLLRGGDDVVQLVSDAYEPDGVWDEIGRWPRRRLNAALVAAVGVIQGDEPNEVAYDHHPAATNHGRSGRDRVAIATAAESDGH